MTQDDYGTRVALLEEHILSDRGRLKSLERQEDERWDAFVNEWGVYKSYIEKRLSDLNGEAGRLKTILDNSVPLSNFNAYVNAERDKQDAKDKAARERFEEYASTQARAFGIYKDEIAKWRGSINVRIASWAGGAAVFIFLLELWLKYGNKQ